MASPTVMTAVLARIAANWTRMPVSDINKNPDPPTDGYLDVEFPIANETPITIGAPGSNVYREEGAFRLVMSAPIGEGLDPYQGWFDELRVLFRGQVFDGVTTWAASPPTIDDRNDQGSYFRLSCAIPYQFDTFA